MFHRLAFYSLLLTLAAAAPASAQPYTVIDLGALPGQSISIPTDINNQLQVVGTSGDQAVLWDRSGVHPLGITVDSPLHINNSGIVAGVRLVDGRRRPFVWFNGSTFDLPAPAEDIQEVRELTDNGLVLMEGTRSYLLFGPNLYDLTALFGGSVHAINQDGMVGGLANFRPFARFPNGRVIVPWTQSFTPVTTIGSSGHFAGYTNNGVFLERWYYGTPDGTVTTIQPIAGNGMALAAINRAGDLVGHYVSSGGFGHPFLYRDGRLYDLNALLVGGFQSRLQRITGINDLGYIIGTSFVGSGFNSSRAVILVPVAPEPPTGLTSTVVGTVVTLQWSAALGAVDYIVQAGNTSGASNLFNASVGAQTSVSAPVPSGRYFVRVRARNAVGVSAPSAEVVVDVP